MAEFAANNHVNASTRITSFFADNGFHPCTNVEPPHTNQENSQRAELLAADKIVKNQEEMTLFLQDQLTWAQQEQAY